jgi:hypothetical protein
LLFAVCGLNRTSAQNTTQATAVPLILPAGLVFDAAGDLIFAEMGNHLIRMVSPAGVLTTLAGTGVQGFSGDGGLASAARFDSPQAVALDSAGNLYIADTHNHRIRRVDAITGLIATVAGTGTAGTSPNGTRAGAAQIDLPVALAFDTLDNLYFADARSHLVLELVQASGTLITVAGDGTQGFAGDGGAATSAEIDSPYGLAVDAAGDLFLADTHNHRVRRVDAQGLPVSRARRVPLPARASTCRGGWSPMLPAICSSSIRPINGSGGSTQGPERSQRSPEPVCKASPVMADWRRLRGSICHRRSS